MNLLPPRVLGPLSECRQSVHVDGDLTGATVHMYANGNEVASRIETWWRQVFRVSRSWQSSG
jgi:hypothetical protein